MIIDIAMVLNALFYKNYMLHNESECVYQSMKGCLFRASISFFVPSPPDPSLFLGSFCNNFDIKSFASSDKFASSGKQYFNSLMF